MQLTPLIAVHMTAAIGAVVTGPVALWARKGRAQRPRLHRAFHLLIPVTLFGIAGAFWYLANGNIAGHRRVMQKLYIGACLVAGAFTLLPQRLLGQLLWSQFGLA